MSTFAPKTHLDKRSNSWDQVIVADSLDYGNLIPAMEEQASAGRSKEATLLNPPPLHYINAPRRSRNTQIIRACVGLFLVTTTFVAAAFVLGNMLPHATSSRSTATVNFKPGTQVIITSGTSIPLVNDPQDTARYNAPEFQLPVDYPK